MCPMDKEWKTLAVENGHLPMDTNHKVSYYQVKRCDGCPLRSLCHQAKGNRTIEVNHRLNQLRAKAKELLTSEKDSSIEVNAQRS